MRELNARLADQHATLEDGVRSQSNGLIQLDPCGRVQALNPAAERLLRCSNNEAVGEDLFTTVFLPNDPDASAAAAGLATMAGGQRRAALDAILIRHDGSQFPAAWELNPLTKGQAVIGMVFVFRDITMHKEIEATQRRAREEAEAASRSKSEF